jgi:DNA mismatch endonuclease (patch repair protein)
MSRIRDKNTRPEITVRSSLHRAGLRFRLHSSSLPGRPDIVLSKYGTVVFVNGCFWHRHGCEFTNTPKSNVKFWVDKFRRNVKRDRKVQMMLKSLGWNVIVIWGCQVSNDKIIRDMISKIRKGKRCG